ncbi:TPA: hypothetical protein ACNVAS_004209 [Citrobacter amalonaticus]|uniref:hypothetical protein n=1 Tax=Citrobacter TaxID=544 RepID=UPI00292B6DB1|nr:hypothetical protein [Citrobacter amalonaticus]EKW3844797.1 hypothetical protein [Citrobacter amalonaticus]MDV0784216.1 hypothetical protein [Citrobacter amalonaticus]MEB0640279.1 hypothetical protein [Citrobacter amalonaticus]
MSYEIKIGKHSIMLNNYVGSVTAPNTQIGVLFKGMSDAFVGLRTVAQQAEAEADLMDAIRNDPDLNEQAKNRRTSEARNPDTLRRFSRGIAAVNEQAGNILDYLQNKLAPVKPLAAEDIQGFLRDSEMRQAFARLDRLSREKMLVSMHGGKHSELGDALLRGHPICSGMDTEQLKRLAFSRISADNAPVINAVDELVSAVKKDSLQLTAIRTWYANLIFGSSDDPADVLPRMTTLDALADYVGSMKKISLRQGKEDEQQAA